jgi:hypothetical protein
MVMLNLAVRFLVELLAVGFVGYWGFTASDDLIIGAVLAIGAVALFAVVWGLFLAPNATRGLTRIQKDIVGTIVLLVAAGALALAGQPTVAVVYAVVVVVNAGILLVLGDQVDRSLQRFGPRG